MGSHRVRHNWSDLAAAASFQEVTQAHVSHWKFRKDHFAHITTNYLLLVLPIWWVGSYLTSWFSFSFPQSLSEFGTLSNTFYSHLDLLFYEILISILWLLSYCVVFLLINKKSKILLTNFQHLVKLSVSRAKIIYLILLLSINYLQCPILETPSWEIQHAHTQSLSRV